MRLWRSPSFRTVLVLWTGLCLASLFFRPLFLFGWDSFGYQLYLPAFFLHHDPLVRDMAWVEEARNTYQTWGALYQISTLPDGAHVPKYTVGLAVLWAPWFLLGDLFAHLTGAPTDGYSAPYQTAVQAGVLVYLLSGLFALRKVLLALFSEGVTSIALALVLIATNLIDQVISGTTMPHLPLFCLYAFIVLLTREWSLDRRPRKALALAVPMGLAVLIRPSEAVCLLIPLLWASEGEHANPFIRVWRLRGQWGLIICMLFIIGVPQFLYWHAATGHWFVDTYTNAGEGFDLLGPHTWKFLFSFRKGWYVYTPLMLMATGGIFLLGRCAKAAFLPVLCFFLANLYLLSSWSCWWYAESFGSRAMVGSYAVMTLPLAALLERVLAWQRPYRWVAVAALSCITLLNLFQYWQFKRLLIHPSRMTRSAYLAVFGRTERPADFKELLLVDRWLSGPPRAPDPSRYGRRQLPASIIAPSPSDTLIADSLGGAPHHAYILRGKDTFTPAIRVPFHALTARDHAWVEAEWHVKVPARPFDGGFINHMEHTGLSYAYDGKDLDPFDPAPGEWSTIRTWYLTPEVRSVEDHFVIYFWSRDTLPVLVEGPYITVHEPLHPLD